MSSHRKDRGNRPRRTQGKAEPSGARRTGAVPLAEAGTERQSPMMNALSFAGYMLAMWLITQTFNEVSSGRGGAFAWSPAVLGVVVGISTAIVKDERGVRGRLGIADFSSRRATLVWGGLGLVAIVAIMTLPR